MRWVGLARLLPRRRPLPPRCRSVRWLGPARCRHVAASCVGWVGRGFATPVVPSLPPRALGGSGH
eukprot:7574480-Pyramimonas_sp.AAC.1